MMENFLLLTGDVLQVSPLSRNFMSGSVSLHHPVFLHGVHKENKVEFSNVTAE